jgi:hypothetical protein
MLMNTGVRLAKVCLRGKMRDMRAGSRLRWVPQTVHSASGAGLLCASWSLKHGTILKDISRLDTRMRPFSIVIVHVGLPEAFALVADVVLSAKGKRIALLSRLYFLSSIDLILLHASVLTPFLQRLIPHFSSKS